jgi:hypothetical protein
LQSPLLFVRIRICFSRRDTEDGWLRLRSRLEMVRLTKVGWKILCSKHQITSLIAPQACLNNVEHLSGKREVITHLRMTITAC